MEKAIEVVYDGKDEVIMPSEIMKDYKLKPGMCIIFQTCSNCPDAVVCRLKQKDTTKI